MTTAITTTMKSFSVVLVESHSPGNLGAIARIMANMDLSDMRLVKPMTRPNHKDALDRAVGATDVLKAAKVYKSIQEATADCEFIIATTGRDSSRRNFITPKGIVKIIKEKKYKKIALMFGNERYGLTKEQMFFAHRLVQIPTSAKVPSLNISHAAAIVFHELFCAFGKYERLMLKHIWAKSKEKERFFVHLEEALSAINYLDKKNPKIMMTEIRAIFGRSDLSTRETNFLRGLCAKILYAAEQKKGKKKNK